MIKIQNNQLTREALPAFLLGLQTESLRDLSWSDPALGVQDCAWLPEVDQAPPLQQYERYGDETLTLGDNVVIVMRAVEPWSAEEIAADVEAKRLASIPSQVTMRQACIQLESAGLLDDVEAIVVTLPRIYQIEWQRASTVQRDNPLVEMVRQQQNMTVEQIDDLFIAAAKL